MPRKRHTLKLKERELVLGDRTLLIGVVDLAEPPAASGAAHTLDADVAFARALQLEQDGADIIEIAPDPFHPGTKRVAEGEEIRRLVPLLKLLRNRSLVPIAVNTWQAAVAEKAFAMGVEILIDPSGLTVTPELAKLAAKYDAGLVVNHSRGTPETWAKLPPLADPLAAVTAELEASIHRARRVGLLPVQIVIDPGLDMGKRKDENTLILANLGTLRKFDLPISVHPSQKPFLAQKTPDGLRSATIGAAVAAILGGAYFVRVHDVAATLPAAAIADAILRHE